MALSKQQASEDLYFGNFCGLFIVQVTAAPLSVDGQQDPDIVAINVVSAALMCSSISWNGPVG